jgi:CBS domain-containing protein
MSEEVSTMARTDIHFDAMLRHLGAAYYESLHGRATRADVTRALDTVEEHLNEHSSRSAPVRASARPHPGHPAKQPQHSRHWARRVRDVMTTSVVTVDRITPYKEIDRLLTEHRISGVPVLTMGRHVAGVVTEADLLAVQDQTAREHRMEAEIGHRRLLRKPHHTSLVAEALMTKPAITIHPDATIPAAARMMNTHHTRRLPVVDPGGKLIGIVSRRDLLSVFLRPDTDITGDVQRVLDELPFPDPTDVTALVRNGVVTLTGTVQPPEDRHHDLARLAIRLIGDIDGVVDVVNRLSVVKGSEEASGPEAVMGPEGDSEDFGSEPAQTA